jgi:hypothetical protein
MLIFPRMKRNDFITSAKPPKRPLSSFIYQSPLVSGLQASLRDASFISIIFPRAKAHGYIHHVAPRLRGRVLLVPRPSILGSRLWSLDHWRLGISLEFGPLSLVIYLPVTLLQNPSSA